MIILVISDIHANINALEAVLDVADSYEAVWCLGDLVGYGPDPNECIERVRALPELLCLIGNHDQAAMGMIPLSRFNREAGAIAAWTRQVLTQENIDFLRSLPSKITFDNFTLAHGSPNQPVWEYILDQHTADRSFDSLKTDYGLVGHTHLPVIFHRPDGDAFAKSKYVQWEKNMPIAPKMILNPGSVGQPRDRDPRASFAILDTQTLTWEMRRIAYDIAQVQMRILDAGLPERQALRLTAGW
ncbi:MAG: metallophosphoesterase [Anaerolineales bacterium]|nr:metallophosphoesterase [Anaerolineales bacterium]